MDERNIENFCGCRFGLFIHWGLYSSLGGCYNGQSMDYIGEWVQAHFRIPNREYAKLATGFNPIEFNAEEWVSLAKSAGMKYLVFTAKHHDGFAMFHSSYDKFNIVDATPFGRDVLQELATACRRHDMHLGVYYSHCLDWSDENGADPGEDHPKNFGMSWSNDWDFPNTEDKDFAKYFTNKVKTQVTEILTNYGDIFLLWFDCPMVITREQCSELRALVHSLQPDCLINGRIGFGQGDFGSLGDNKQPADRAFRPIESPGTLNRTWGFKWDDHNWMSPTQVLKTFSSLSDKGANYLLNIGPRPDGKFPDSPVDILKEVAEWKDSEKVQIQNTHPNPFPQSFSWGSCVICEDILEFFVHEKRERLNISGIRNNITSCNVPYEQKGDEVEFFLTDCSNSPLPVIKAKFSGKLDIDPRLRPQNKNLELRISSGKLLHGDQHCSSMHETPVNTIGEKHEEGEKCFIESGGALTQWHHPGDGICWEVYLPESGEYEVWVLTENRVHSAEWVGLRTVEIQFAGLVNVAELQEDQKTPSQYYSQAWSCLSTIKITVPTTDFLIIKTRKIKDRKAINMNLFKAKLVKK